MPQVSGAARPSGVTTRQRNAARPVWRLALRIGSSTEATSRIEARGRIRTAMSRVARDGAKIVSEFAMFLS